MEQEGKSAAAQGKEFPAGSAAGELARLFDRDLARLDREIESFPSEEALWRRLPGISNPAGNLALHLEGNLREYVGRRLGNLPYRRNRELEFSAHGVARSQLGLRIKELRRTIPLVLAGLSSAQLEMIYPEVVLEAATSTRQFLMHLLGHLNWHLGQIDYLRRVLTGDGAIQLPGLAPGGPELRP